MTADELMMPRYKVAADYPQSPYSVGDIISYINPTAQWQLKRQDGTGKFISSSKALIFAMYPHLFRKLEWWEDRAIEDMPEYIMSYDDIFHVEYDFKNNNIFIIFKEGGKAVLTLKSLLSTSIPATKEEYEAMLLQQK